MNVADLIFQQSEAVKDADKIEHSDSVPDDGDLKISNFDQRYVTNYEMIPEEKKSKKKKVDKHVAVEIVDKELAQSYEEL